MTFTATWGPKSFAAPLRSMLAEASFLTLKFAVVGVMEVGTMLMPPAAGSSVMLEEPPASSSLIVNEPSVLPVPREIVPSVVVALALSTETLWPALTDAEMSPPKRFEVFPSVMLPPVAVKRRRRSGRERRPD